jgi:hypothetical protein
LLLLISEVWVLQKQGAIIAATSGNKYQSENKQSLGEARFWMKKRQNNGEDYAGKWVAT